MRKGPKRTSLPPKENVMRSKRPLPDSDHSCLPTALSNRSAVTALVQASKSKPRRLGWSALSFVNEAVASWADTAQALERWPLVAVARWQFGSSTSGRPSPEE
jgi:hypothetical protein